MTTLALATLCLIEFGFIGFLMRKRRVKLSPPQPLPPPVMLSVTDLKKMTTREYSKCRRDLLTFAHQHRMASYAVVSGDHVDPR